MSVSSDDIKAIKPGVIKPFLCDDTKDMYSACSLVTRIKRVGMPEGVSGYETQKFYENNILLIRAMREGDEKVLNR